MEVASPLTLVSSANKRSLACSPPLGSDRMSKRRRFHADTSVDALSEDFSAHSLLFKAKQQGQPSIFTTGGKFEPSGQYV